MVQIDARGLSCPEPVILTMKSIDAGNTEIEVLLNTKSSIENVTRFATNKGFKVEKKDNGADTTLILTK